MNLNIQNETLAREFSGISAGSSSTKDSLGEVKRIFRREDNVFKSI